MKKGYFIIFIILLILITGCRKEEYKPNGLGTEESPYEIKNVEDLKYVNKELSAYYKLMNDINLEAIEWDPIGVEYDDNHNDPIEAKPFSGYFDGNGFSINNLTIKNTQDDYVGLFHYNSGTIINLGVVDIHIVINKYNTNYIGVITGYNFGKIYSSYTSGEIELNTRADYIGGISGGTNSIIKDCYSSVNITSLNTDKWNGYIGGITGINGGEIINTFTIGTLRSGYHSGRVGGIVGKNDIYSQLKNSFSTSNVDGSTSGGIVVNRPSNIENSYDYKGQIIGFTFYSNIDDNQIGLTELNSKNWYKDVLGWDETIWNLDVVNNGYYPKLINSNAESMLLPTSYQLGSEGNPIKIYTTEDLINLKNSIFLHAHYKLMNDIDLSGIDWIPLGTKEEPFRGYFNGNGHTISNLTINGNYEYSGLFGYFIGTINDIHLSNVNITLTNSEPSYAGGLIGYIFNVGFDLSEFHPFEKIIDYYLSNCSVENINIISLYKSYKGDLIGNEQELNN